MKPVDFAYHHPESLEEVLGLSRDGSASIVSGNQSLGPMINLRLSRPESLIDLSRLDALCGAEKTPGGVSFGAAVTHASIEDGKAPDPTGGWMQNVARNIAHRAVRNRGTIGGSLCHADPAADWVTVLPALGATVTLARPGGQSRQMAVLDFVIGPYQNALMPGEVLTRIDVPTPSASARWGYWKYVRQVGEFSKASAAILTDLENGLTRLIVSALGSKPVLIPKADAVLAGKMNGAAALREVLGEADHQKFRLHAIAIDRAVRQITLSAPPEARRAGSRS